jgi:hypothetical protein
VVVPSPDTDGAVWDLPADKRPDGRTAANPTPAVVQPRPASGPTFNDRMAQAIAAQRLLAAQNARLSTKRAELQRWDEAAQEKFQQAFGTTDAAARQLVLRKVEQQIDRNAKLMVTLADAVNFEFYVRTKKAK